MPYIKHILTYSMVQSPSWESNWFAASQEIPRISRNPKVHYRTHKRPPPVSIRGQPNPVPIPTSHLLEIHPNIIHPSTSRSPQWSLSLRFPHQDPIHPPLLTPYAPHAQPISVFSILSPAQYWVRSTNHLAPRYAVSCNPALPRPSWEELKHTKKNCAPSWLYLQDYTQLHGQQNAKLEVSYEVLLCVSLCAIICTHTQHCWVILTMHSRYIISPSVMFKSHYGEMTGTLCSSYRPIQVIVIVTWKHFLRKEFHCNRSWSTGDRGSTVVNVLCYKSEGRWFDPSWCQWILYLHKILPIALWPWGRLSL